MKLRWNTDSKRMAESTRPHFTQDFYSRGFSQDERGLNVENKICTN